MKANIMLPPGGLGVSGNEIIPEFGSKECHSRIKVFEVEMKEDERGEHYIHPISGKRVDKPTEGWPKNSVKFTKIP